MSDREEALEAWKENPEVDWDADNEGVLSFRVEYETDDQGFWLTDVDPSLSIFTNADVVTLDIHEDTDEGRLSAGLGLTPAEAQRLGRQLIFAGETAGEGRDTDVRH